MPRLSMTSLRKGRAVWCWIPCLASSALLTGCQNKARPAANALPAGVTVAAMGDDRDAARLCGYLATRPESPMRFPWPAAADTATPALLLGYLDGPEVRGVRVVVPGNPARYVFRGLTTDGRQRITLERPIPELNAPDAIARAEASPPAALAALDSAALSIAVPSPTLSSPMPGAWPDSTEEPDRAVPDLHRLPESRVVLDTACPIATLGTQALPRVDRIFRVEVPAGRTLFVRARGSVHGLVLAIDAPATPDSARTKVRMVAVDSVRVDEARSVAVRLRTVPAARDRESSSFVIVTMRLQ